MLIQELIEKFSIYDVPSNYKDFMDFFETEANRAPKEFKDKVNFEFETEEEYGSTYTYVNIFYWRPETKEEELLKKEAKEEYDKDQKKRDMAELKRLHEKYFK